MQRTTLSSGSHIAVWKVSVPKAMMQRTHNFHLCPCPVSKSCRRPWRFTQRRRPFKGSQSSTPSFGIPHAQVNEASLNSQGPGMKGDEKGVPNDWMTSTERQWEAIKDDPRLPEVYDKLIDLFRSKPRDQWKRLLAISRNWIMLATGVFERIDHYTDLEKDPGKKLEWKGFRKALLNVHTEVSRYDEVLGEFFTTNSWEWDAIVATRRSDMGPGFFEHLTEVISAGDDDPKQQEKLKEISSSALALVEMHDQAQADQMGLDLAKDSLMDILQSDSIQEVDRRMDQLAATGGLDGPMMLTIAKMYTSVKESEYSKDEVKQIMYHLYMKSKETLQSQQPPVVRILKYILTIQDPAELKKCLDDAFTPGELPSAELDYLYATPTEMMKTIDSVLTAFEQQKGKHTALGEASGMMNPEVIQKLRKLEVFIRKEYM